VDLTEGRSRWDRTSEGPLELIERRGRWGRTSEGSLGSIERRSGRLGRTSISGTLPRRKNFLPRAGRRHAFQHRTSPRRGDLPVLRDIRVEGVRAVGIPAGVLTDAELAF